MERYRSVQIDILKGLAIISVILLHSWDASFLLRIGAPYYISQAVPIFIIIAAYNGVCSPESISHTLYPRTRNTGYEIRPTQDPLDYSPKAEGCAYKTDCFGYEDIAETGAADLERLFR